MEITKDLLIHWWLHFALLPYTSEEFEKFKEVIDTFGEQKILDFITFYYPITEGKNILLLCAVRTNRVDEMFATIPDPQTMKPDEKAEWYENQNTFLQQLKKSYEQA